MEPKWKYLIIILAIPVLFGYSPVSTSADKGGKGGGQCDGRLESPAIVMISGQVWVMEADGCDARCVFFWDKFSQPTIIVRPHWGPGSSPYKIALNDLEGIRRIDFHIENGEPVTDSVEIVANGTVPAWNPAYPEIAYTKQARVRVSPDNGSNPTGVGVYTYPVGTKGYDATWSGDGERLAFALEISSCQYTITILERQGDPDPLVEWPVVMTLGPYSFCQMRDLDWAHSKDVIAFSADEVVYTVDFQGLPPQLGPQYVDPEFIAVGRSPSWTPDDSGLVYEKGIGGGNHKGIMEIDLTTGIATQLSARYASPDRIR